ncbi:hypothetical protein [Sinorhizobium americanum]|uniref:hypothetical protein n=1 Tax=Sinorhizobium americanum TaxID=194963 RepID=UPI001FDAB2C2|nr:hypothetical protein [Sinorhizobium americanum]
MGERGPDTAGISAPVFGPRHVVMGAMTLSGPRTPVDEGLSRFERPPLLEAAARATRAFGDEVIIR